MKQYVRNYMGYEMTDDELQEIPYPNFELGVHITARTLQVGCILGTVYGTLKALTAQPTRNLAGISRQIGAVSPRIILPFTLFGPVLTTGFIMFNKIDQDGVIDRCYRLRRNTCQMRVDRFTDTGAAVGVVSSLAIGSSIWTGVAAGVTAGVVTAAVYNTKIAEKK